MRKTIQAIVLASIFSVPYHVQAGIPVIDGTQILNQIRELNQDLLNFKEYVEQTALSQKELVSAYQAYDQMLSDYQQVLREARALQGRIEGMNPKEWLDELANLAKKHDPLYGGASGISRNTGYQPWDDAVERNRLLNGYDMTDEEYEAMLTELPLSGDDRNRARQVFQYRQRKVAEGIKKDAYVIGLENELSEQADKIDRMDTRRIENQGDNNLTASVQFLAEQNQQLLSQIHTMQTQQAEQMKSSDRLADHYFNNMAKAEERRMRNKGENKNDY